MFNKSTRVTASKDQSEIILELAERRFRLPLTHYVIDGRNGVVVHVPVKLGEILGEMPYKAFKAKIQPLFPKCLIQTRTAVTNSSFRVTEDVPALETCN